MFIQVIRTPGVKAAKTCDVASSVGVKSYTFARFRDSLNVRCSLAL
jgi:hypothetical protein